MYVLVYLYLFDMFIIFYLCIIPNGLLFIGHSFLDYCCVILPLEKPFRIVFRKAVGKEPDDSASDARNTARRGCDVPSYPRAPSPGSLRNGRYNKIIQA